MLLKFPSPVHSKVSCSYYEEPLRLLGIPMPDVFRISVSIFDDFIDWERGE